MEYTKRYLYMTEESYYLFNGILHRKTPIGFMVVKNNYPLKKGPILLIKTFKNLL